MSALRANRSPPPHVHHSHRDAQRDEGAQGALGARAAPSDEYIPPQARKHEQLSLEAAAAAEQHPECPATRKPYHVVMTAASGLYQEWQSRIAYYHYQKQKRIGGACSDVGGFTRLFNSPDAKPDTLMDEMPTLLVKQLGHGGCDECDHGFIVMNRPWGAVQFVETEYFRTIPEDYLFLIETDHMLLRPPVNTATKEMPVGFGFYYMISTDPKLEPVVRKFLNPEIDITTVDAVGPSPLLVHKPMLAKLARPWWELSMKMKGDEDANKIFGWVLEMWGYNIAARNLGIRHTVSHSIQVEPQGIGTDSIEGKDIYHYTFGHKLQGWDLDKRMYFGKYPPDYMEPPPACSAKSASLIRDLWMEAAHGIPGWKNKVEPARARPSVNTTTPLRKLTARPREGTENLAQLLVGTGPWQWGRLQGLYFFSRGIAYAHQPDNAPPLSGQGIGSNKPVHGTWRAQQDGSIAVLFCGIQYILSFADQSKPWAFTAVKAAAGSSAAEARAPGWLSSSVQQSALMHPLAPMLLPGAFGDCDGAGTCTAPNTTLTEELAGSGPWEWAGIAPLGFMRGGQLITPWGQGTWGSKRGAGSESAPADAVFADFANSQHSIKVVDRTCLRLGSTRKVDGEIVSVSLSVPDGEYGAPSTSNACHSSGLDKAVQAA